MTENTPKALETGALEFIKQITEDAVWEEVAMEFIEKLDYDFQKMFRRNKAELETLGRYIVSERTRKYFEGLEDGKSSGDTEDPIVNSFLGGFTLCGSQTDEGKIKGAVGDMEINEWPEEVTLAGHTYSLASHSPNPENLHKNLHLEAEYC